MRGQAGWLVRHALGFGLSLAPLSSPAHAACPIELATYADRDKAAEINFTPALKSGATVTNSFRMLLEKDVVLDGFVQWTEGVERAYGALQYKCPTGDVTGEEYAACTVWQGVIYTADEQGTIDLLPAEGKPAPKQLIFADLGPSVHAFPGFGMGSPLKAPWDVFQISGCQE